MPRSDHPWGSDRSRLRIVCGAMLVLLLLMLAAAWALSRARPRPGASRLGADRAMALLAAPERARPAAQSPMNIVSPAA